MRSYTILGAILLVVGLGLLVASSGAFDSTTADRGVGIETAADEDALLGLEYSTEDRTVALESDDSDGGGLCIFACSAYDYTDRELVALTDNTPAGDLVIEDVEFDGIDHDIVDGIEHTDDDVVRGDFNCPASGSLFGYGDQEARTATVSIDVVASNGEVTIDLERTIDIECVADA